LRTSANLNLTDLSVRFGFLRTSLNLNLMDLSGGFRFGFRVQQNPPLNRTEPNRGITSRACIARGRELEDSVLGAVLIVPPAVSGATDMDEHCSAVDAHGGCARLQKGPTQVSPLVFAFLLAITASNVSIITPCSQLQIEPPLHPISKPSSMRPWKSTPNALVKISAIMNSPECSIDESLRMRSSLYSRSNPRHLMNSGMAIQS